MGFRTSSIVRILKNYVVHHRQNPIEDINMVKKPTKV
jgi:hypothetical protein